MPASQMTLVGQNMLGEIRRKVKIAATYNDTKKTVPGRVFGEKRTSVGDPLLSNMFFLYHTYDDDILPFFLSSLNILCIVHLCTIKRGSSVCLRAKLKV
jgi:hypothetical protein